MNIVQLALENGYQHDCKEFAEWLDENDPLKNTRDEFQIPTFDSLRRLAGCELITSEQDDKTRSTYLCGLSMGLQPKRLREEINVALDQWAGLGVLSYHVGSLPASSCDLDVTADVAKHIVGAEPDEVAVTANLSVNMHSLLATFYRPNGLKSAILVEEGLFPSDQYILESQICWHGLDPNKEIIRMKPRTGDWCLRTDDIIQTIHTHANRLALVFLPGVQYVTGQFFDMEFITYATHEVAQCPIGWDLAHVVGNIPLQLHNWNVDMAVWCSYKYLNGSPGAAGGLFVHRKHHHMTGCSGPDIAKPGVIQKAPQLTGWWSHRSETRMHMTGQMELAPGASAYRISNPPLLLCVALKASLAIFKECGGMQPIRTKSMQLTGYLESLLTDGKFALSPETFQIITPADPKARGAQLTISVANNLEELVNALFKEGFLFDVRQPRCIRVAPAPLYNTYVDVYHFADRLASLARDLC